MDLLLLEDILLHLFIIKTKLLCLSMNVFLQQIIVDVYGVKMKWNKSDKRKTLVCETNISKLQMLPKYIITVYSHE